MTFEEFRKVDLRVAKVLYAERVSGSEKLVRLEVDAGDTGEAGERAIRQIVAGIGSAYDAALLEGKYIAIVANLEPRILMGIRSNGMLLAATDGEGLPVLLQPDRDILPGTEIR